MTEKTPQMYFDPQSIPIGTGLVQAVPRKSGSYDTEGIPAATNIPAQLSYFQNKTSFSLAGLASGQSKVYGRDTNMTSQQGAVPKGERLYIYGMSAKVSTLNAILNTLANSVWFDQLRRFWELTSLTFKLGSDEFVVLQGRDVPLMAARARHAQILQAVAADAFLLLPDVASDGMYSLQIEGQPYIIDQQEDFEIVLAASPNTLQFIVDTYFTMRLEGIRLKALRG